ncbi:MAG: hypothetical protein ABIH23_01695, partial [bacterium]
MPGIDLFEPTTQVNPNILLGVSIGLAILIFITVYGIYRYQRWLHFMIFENEIKMLDLDPDEVSMLSEMVKRYAKHNPDEVLRSQSFFDDIASKEMQRILSSGQSAEDKEQFIDA